MGYHTCHKCGVTAGVPFLVSPPSLPHRATALPPPQPLNQAYPPPPHALPPTLLHACPLPISPLTSPLTHTSDEHPPHPPDSSPPQPPPPKHLCFTPAPSPDSSPPLCPPQAWHFFKVGQPRAQGKTMLLCLAQQLAEGLAGMAGLLLPVVTEHGDAGQLSMKDTFER